MNATYWVPPARKGTFHYQPRTIQQWAEHLYDSRNTAFEEYKHCDRIAAEYHYVPFNFYITINPDREGVTIAQLRAYFSRFLETYASYLETACGRKCVLAYIVGYEMKAKHGGRDPHIHICLLSRPYGNEKKIESIWRDMVGTNPENVDIQGFAPFERKGNPYPKMSTVSYCLKEAAETGEWDLSPNLDTFKPMDNARTRREARRHEQRPPSPFAVAMRKRYGLPPLQPLYLRSQPGC
jgi:hypothetical protein